MNTADGRSDHFNERRHQARVWFVIRQPHRGLSVELEKEWETWAADARNLAEYREYEKVDRLLRALPRRPLPTDEELHARLGAHSRVDRHLVPSPRLVYALAVSAIVVAVGFWFGPRLASVLRPAQPQVFQTVPGQRRAVTLQDHSVIRMGGATRLSVLFSNEARLVTLYEGEAMLDVTPNPQLPFQVDAEATRVTVLGTTFHVRRYTDRQVIVEVEEGTVEITPRQREVHDARTDQPSDRLHTVTVKAGQEVSTDATGQMTPAHPADFQALTWWLYGRRVYREKPLGRVIEDLQLYFPRRIEYNRALDSLPFNGIIDPSKPEESIRGLEEVFPVKVDDSDPRRIIIRCRQPDCR